MKRLHCIVRGRVQGVSFRAYTQREARRLGLGGWVRNLPDGAVEAVAEGDEARLGDLLAWLHHGPSHARVDAVSPTWSDADGGFHDFQIRY